MDKQYSVLLVDDDKFLLDMYSLKFSKSGLTVQVAQGSLAALKILRDGYISDILLLDIVMPTMDGLELLSVIRKEGLVPKATVVMLTNQSQSADIDRAKALNVDGYIVKATTIPSEVVSEVLDIVKKHKTNGL
ncbi:MAG: response regulator [Candidatus Taylorbacteria bacterium]|nr:response regulator [Candidatus Taylorbacteria bacterium]